MLMLEKWLREFEVSQRILDLGCGSGSLAGQMAGLNVTGVDVDATALAKNRGLPSACADSHRLPFAAESFELVICHHSLEHFHDVPGTVREIRRVLRRDGRLFVSVPDGRSFSDRLYRFLLCGGGHLQRFTFESIVSEIELGTGLHLAGWKELSTSYIFVDRRNFLPAPWGRLPGPFPRRMRWFGKLPAWAFSGARIVLNMRRGRYGWALAFTPSETNPVEEPRSRNVCMHCGAGFDERVVSWFFYRCPYCAGGNYGFGG